MAEFRNILKRLIYERKVFAIKIRKLFKINMEKSKEVEFNYNWCLEYR